MKKIIFSIFSIALTSSVIAQPLDRSIRPKAGPAPEITFGKLESFTLDNGLKVFVVENHKLPTISCSIELDIKPALEKDEAGYRDAVSELLLTGTKTRSDDQLNSQIDFIGANINASSEGLYGASLTKYEDKLFDLMSDIAMNATFKQEELDKIKKRTLSELEAAKNEPDAMLSNVTAALDYGPAHPYGEVNTDQTVTNIKLKSCENYYHTYFRPNVAYMAIVGDITVEQAKALVKKYYAKWQKATVPTTEYGHYPAPAATDVAFVPREGAVQSVINVTYPIDLKPGSDDVVKARVANTILGGGSQGRLFLDLREKHGWTYGSYSSIKDDELVGNFTAYAKCRNAVTDSAVGAILDEMNKMRTEKVSDTSLENSISYMSGNFAISLEDRARIAQFAINIERYHMPKDYYKNYLKNLAAVTSDDVMNVARAYIEPEHAHVIVVGSKDEAKKLAVYANNGKVSYYDNYGKPITVSEMKSVPAGITAESIMKKYIDAIGGAKTIESIKDIKTVSTSSIQGTPITITIIKKQPDMMKQAIDVVNNGQSMTVQKQVFNGTTGYQEVQGQKRDMSADDIEESKMEGDIAADLHPEKYGIERKVIGMDQIDGTDVYVVDATAKAKKVTEYYDVNTGLLMKKVESQSTPQGPVTQTSTYADYKEVPGTSYKIPYSVTETAGPMTLVSKVQSVEVNKGIPDSDFN